MYRIVLVGLLAVACCACKPMNPTPPKSFSDPAPKAPAAKTEVTIATVEFAVRMSAVLADQSKAANVTEEQMINKRYELDMSTVTVKPPYPKELWVTFNLKAVQDFKNTPVVLRTKILADKQEIDSFSKVVTELVTTAAPVHSTNVLVKLDTPPKTMLVYAQAEALLMPEGTDAATIDPAALTAAAGRQGTVISNPVRIDFVAEEPAP